MSLLELVVLIAIIGIISAISIVSLVDSQRNAEVEAAAEEVVAVLREAQNYALSGKVIGAGGVGCSNYQVSFASGSPDYSIEMTGPCSGANLNYTLKNGVVVTSIVDIGNVSFSAPHGTSPNQGYLVVEKGATSYSVCINKAGLITKKSGSAGCDI